MKNESEPSNTYVVFSTDTSRRQILGSAAAALMTSVLSRHAAAYPTGLMDTPVPVDEGFFFVVPGKQKNNHGGFDPDPSADRVFFISSSWLPLFEITDIIAQPTSVTITMASPAALVGWPSHGLNINDKIKFSGDSLPDPLIAGKTYKVGQLNDNNSFYLAEKNGNPVIATANGSGIGTKKGRKEKIVHDHFADSWKVLYSDDVPNIVGGNPSGATVVPLPLPPSGSTYLAMSIV